MMLKIKLNKLLFLLSFLILGCTENDAQKDVVDKKIKVVIIGSSIASGMGASSYNYSWVGLLQSTTNDVFVNNAVAGYTTFHFLPEAKTNMKGITPDYSRNITQAIKLSPDLIIFSITTNDIAQGFTMDDFLGNMKTLTDMCVANHIPFLIGSTTPRKLDFDRTVVYYLINRRLEVIYGDNFVDYYNSLANLDTFELEKVFSSGDNLHPNNLGHKIIFESFYPTYLKIKNKILSK